MQIACNRQCCVFVEAGRSAVPTGSMKLAASAVL